MHNSRFLLFISILMLSINVCGQKNTFLSYDLCMIVDNTTFINPEQNIIFSNDREFVPGFILTQQIRKNIYLESGVYLYVPTGVDMISLSADTTNFIYLLEELQIPIRVRLQKSLLNERLNPFFTVGTTIALKESNYSGLYSRNQESSILNMSNEYSKSRMLIELGAGIDFRITKNFFLGLRYKYNYSLKELVRMEAVVKNDKTDEIKHYKLVVPGHNYSCILSASYRISSIWNKKQ